MFPIPTSIRCAFAPTIGDFPRLVIIMLGPNIELYLVTVTENILYRENILVSEHLIGQSKQMPGSYWLPWALLLTLIPWLVYVLYIVTWRYDSIRLWYQNNVWNSSVHWLESRCCLLSTAFSLFSSVRPPCHTLKHLFVYKYPLLCECFFRWLDDGHGMDRTLTAR